MFYIFHHNDMDGYSAAHVISSTFKDIRSKLISCDYNNTVPDSFYIASKEPPIVYIVDYAFSSDEDYNKLRELCTESEKVIWIDHHKTSEKFVKDHPDLENTKNLSININTEYCGAVLTWFVINHDTVTVDEDKIPLFLRYIDSWDCWKHDMTNTIEFKYGMETYNWNAVINNIYDQLASSDTVQDIIYKIIHTGSIIKKYVDDRNHMELSKNSYESTLSGHRVLAINSAQRSSLLFGELISDYPLCVVYTKIKNKYKYSLYSADKDIDCSAIAEQYGGGGHPGAAGFTSSRYELIDN